jgi:hypothetical protein
VLYCIHHLLMVSEFRLVFFVVFFCGFFYGGEGEEGGIIVCSSIYTFDIPSTIK